jgi:hypothetical protein
VKQVVPSYIGGEDLNHDEGARAATLFMNKGMIKGQKHPGFHLCKLHNLTSMNDPLLWNVLVAVLVAKFDTADTAFKHNELLHALVQDPGEDMITYLTRALEIATDSTLSVKEQLTRIVKGLHQSDAKNTLTTYLSQAKDLSFEEMKVLVTHEWITTAEQMMSELKQPLSGPPNKWCPLLNAKGKATSQQQPNATTPNKKGELAEKPAKKSNLCSYCKEVPYTVAHGKECKVKAEKKEQSSTKEQPPNSKAPPQNGGAAKSG